MILFDKTFFTRRFPMILGLNENLFKNNIRAYERGYIKLKLTVGLFYKITTRTASNTRMFAQIPYLHFAQSTLTLDTQYARALSLFPLTASDGCLPFGKFFKRNCTSLQTLVCSSGVRSRPR